LAAATQGRGLFTISTDRFGPRVTSMSPTTPLTPPLTTITVNFNEAVDPRSLSVNNQAAARKQVLISLLASTEYRRNSVASYYINLLGRPSRPSNAELDGWVSQMAAGQTDEQIIASFLITPEYDGKAQANQTGTTLQRWIKQVYLDLLQRPASPQEITDAETAINGGTSRFNFALNTILKGTEYRTLLLQGWTRQYLR